MADRLPVYNIESIPRETRLHEGRMTRYSLRTKHGQIVFATITPQPPGQQKNHRPPHDHPYDMLLIVIEGTMMMEIDDDEYKIEAGHAIIVPAFAMHRGYAYGEETVSLIEMFAPVRQDYIHLVEYQEEDFEDRGEGWVREEHNSWNPPTKGI